jgi:hypothetical protein
MSSMSNVLQMMSGGMPGGMSAASLTDQLNEISRRDSRLAPFVQCLQQRLAAKANIIEAEPVESDPVEPQTAQIAETSNHSLRDEKIRNLTRRMYAELQMLRTRNEMLAEALGACSQCWGDDRECDYCGGEGRVGSYLISARVFEQVVGPALDQIRRRPQLVQQQINTHKGEENHALR